jgi:REP element-mobilizing transposase RayT
VRGSSVRSIVRPIVGISSPSVALAYFITFSTYGTWLHGTSRGKGSVDRDHSQYGAEFVEPDALREAQSRGKLAQEPYTMNAPQREIVRDAIAGLCHEKGWQLLAVHVRTNHVHVVVRVDRDPGRTMSDMKARASRALTRAGFDDANRNRWTRHGSTLHLFDEAIVADKIDYTLNRQGTPMAYYDGRDD